MARHRRDRKSKKSSKRLLGIVAACVVVVTVVLVISLSGRGSTVTFPDPNLETVIREALNQPSGAIHVSELAGLANVTASDSGIEDLSGLQHCTNLSRLDLWHNQVSDISSLANLTNLESLNLGDDGISDISPVANLTNLTEILLHSNQISDISPLVNNPALGQGDHVSLGDNPLSSDSIEVYLPELRARGVAIDS